jgi:uncharacterized protein YdaU (DUF1376 family)
VNYYSHHIGDYLSATAHLTLLEHGAYRRMIDVYYIHESALPLDRKQLYRLIGARTKEEREAVDSVLGEFFTESESGWVQSRCDHEIALCNKNRENGKKGGRPLKSNNPNETQTKPKQNPETTHQESPPSPHHPITPSPHHPITEKAAAAAEPGSPLEAIESAKPSRQKRPTALPEDFSPAETGIAYAVTRRLSLETELASFRNWHQAKGTTMKDWQAAWRTWCDKAVEFGRAGQQGGGGARASPAANSRDEGRRKVLEVLTGGGRNEQRSERDITGEAVRITG